MNCSKCNRSISLTEGIQCCAFCGAEIDIGEGIDDCSTIVSVLEYVVSFKGKVIYSLASRQQFLSLLNDLFPHYRDKLRLYVLAINLGIGDRLYHFDTRDMSSKSLCLSAQIQHFKDVYCIKLEIAEEVVGNLALGLGWKNIKTHKPFTETLKLIHPMMVVIRGGTFIMGSPESEPDRYDDETQHEVTLSDFYIGKYEVTQAQWTAVMGSDNNPSYFKGDNLPVECVSWDKVQEFIQKLNQLTGHKYRLPTEAEWEFACKAGNVTPFNTGNNLTTCQANYNGNYPYNGNPKGVYREKPLPVGSFAPNAWGLYDMHGNVWEWCSDWKDDYLSTYPKDPTDPLDGSFRVIRGGSWKERAQHCRSAYRYYDYPGYNDDGLGFRLALSL